MNPKTFPQLLSQQTPSQVRYDSCTLPWKNVNEDLAKIIVCKNCIWNTLAFAVEQNLDNDITLDGMTINKEGAFGPCILWEVEIQGGGRGLSQ